MRVGVAFALLLCAVAIGAQASSAKPSPGQIIHDIIEHIKAVSGVACACPPSGTAAAARAMPPRPPCLMPPPAAPAGQQ
jgi:hypothetical protein